MKKNRKARICAPGYDIDVKASGYTINTRPGPVNTS